MHKIWFQITGSHSRNQPEWDLYHDGRFFIGGKHSMSDPAIEDAKVRYKAGRNAKWLYLNHTTSAIAKGPYPQYAWYYHNKIQSVDAKGVIAEILNNDPDTFFIYYISYPLLNTLKIAEYFKTALPTRCHIVYYKTKFWDDEIKILKGVSRNFKEKRTRIEEFSELKSTDKELGKIADTAYLADSMNTHGDPALDSPDTCEALKAYRNNFLIINPKYILKSMRGQVYNVYDSIKGA